MRFFCFIRNPLRRRGLDKGSVIPTAYATVVSSSKVVPASIISDSEPLNTTSAAAASEVNTNTEVNTNMSSSSSCSPISFANHVSYDRYDSDTSIASNASIVYDDIAASVEDASAPTFTSTSTPVRRERSPEEIESEHRTLNCYANLMVWVPVLICSL